MQWPYVCVCVPLFLLLLFYVLLFIPIYKCWKSDQFLQTECVRKSLEITLLSDFTILAQNWTKMALQEKKKILFFVTHCWSTFTSSKWGQHNQVSWSSSSVHDIFCCCLRNWLKWKLDGPLITGLHPLASPLCPIGKIHFF